MRGGWSIGMLMGLDLASPSVAAPRMLPGPQYEAAPLFRPDLQAAAGAFCAEEGQTLLKEGIFDTQIELAFVQDVKDFRAFAANFAVDNRHRGYSYGTCRDHRRWIVSTPAPAALLRLDKIHKTLTVDTQALQKDCATYDVDALIATQFQPINLFKDKNPNVEAIVIALDSMDFASLSLTCHPAAKLTQGPELWASIALRPPVTIATLATEKDFLEWLGQQRKAGGLGSLLPAGNDLQNVVDAAATFKDLHHPRALLLDEKLRLGHLGVVILGENRASAPSYGALAELLWNSPQHRRLLLNPLANVIALNISQLPDRSEKLLVMILAKQ